MIRKRSLGRMRHRLKLMALTRIADEGGGNARADVELATVWARVKTMSTFEANTYAQLQQRVTHEAMIRWRSDVAQGMTAIWQRPAGHGGDLSLYIVTSEDADPDGRPGEFLKLVMREGGNL